MIVRNIVKAASGLPNRLPVTGSGMLSRFGGMNIQNSSVSAMGQYASIGALWGVVNRIAEAVSLVEWNLEKQLPDGSREIVDDATPPAKHEATALWTHPNPFMRRQDFMHATDQYMSLAGEVYWLICATGEDPTPFPNRGMQSPVELWPINPAKIRPIADPDRYIAGYAYRNGGEEIPLESEFVVQIKIPDPNNPLRGFGPVQSMLTDLDAERMAAQYNRNVFYNDATPGGIVSFPDAISDVDWERIITRWREQHQGVSNVGRVAMLERGAAWTDVKTTYRDMQWKDLRANNRDNIFLPFGIAGAIMGIAKDVNKANAETARADFALWLLKPRLERYKSALNERVIPYTGDDLAMDYVDPTPEDRAQIVNEAMSLWGWGVQTLNDTLNALGQAPVDGPEGDRRIYELNPAHPLPSETAPPSVPTQTGDSGSKMFLPTGKAWPSAMNRQERAMATAWTGRLGAAKSRAIDYIERSGK